MMSNATRKLGLFANVAVIVLAIVLSAILVKRYLLPHSHTAPEEAAARVRVGTQLSLSGINWSENGRTMLLVLSKDCRYCTESASFYQRLAQERNKYSDLRLIAVLPQSVNDSREYLDRLGVSTDEIRQAPPNEVGVRGTPTLILVDRSGVVKDVWIGKLPTDKETEVINKLRA